MAWLGAVAIVGLVICAFGELRDARWRRKERKLPPGAVLPPRWSGRRVALITVGAVLVLALIGFLVNLALPTPQQVKISTKNASTTTTVGTSTTTTTPVATLPAGGRPPSQVHVAVLNGTGVPKAAGTKALALGTLGYVIVNTGNAPVQATTVVECKPTFNVEAGILAAAVGPGTTVAPYPVTPPSGSAAADCVVVLGK